MKKISSKFILPLIILLLGTGSLLAQNPSSPLWFQQVGFEYDSTTKVYSINLEWEDGEISNGKPQADRYELYRALIGNSNNLDEFDHVATATSANVVDGKYSYTDELDHQGAYEYYLIPFSGTNQGEMSVLIRAFAPTSYCVNLNAEIVDFVSTPQTIIVPGELYEYNAFARHRSPRVQGWVRYTLLDGPTNMTINNESGKLEWSVPSDAVGDYYVKIKATSNEDDRAESIQEWYLRTANQFEIAALGLSIEYSNEEMQISLYPNPASDYLNISKNSDIDVNTIQIIAIDGSVLIEKQLAKQDQITIPLNSLSAGTYFVRMIGTNLNSLSKFVIE